MAEICQSLIRVRPGVGKQVSASSDSNSHVSGFSCLASVFTYRYFLHRFPELCILAVSEDAPDEPIGCVVGKVDDEERLYVAGGASDTTSTSKVGYLGMLAVGQSYRRRGIGKELVRKILQRMKDMGCDSVILETEVTNRTAQQLYQDCFGFVREELLVRYYLNWNDAYRLRLWFV